MRLAIIGSTSSYGSKRILEEAQKRRHYAELIAIDDVLNKTKSLSEFDAALFYGISLHPKEASEMAARLLKNKKTVVDEVIAGGILNNKMNTCGKMQGVNIPYPKSFEFDNLQDAIRKIAQLDFPIVIKPLDGRKGRGIEVFDCMEEAAVYLSRNGTENKMAQEFIPNAGNDIRVIAIGGKALGAIRRIAKRGEFRANIALGASAEKTELTNELKTIAEKAAQAMHYEFAGIDIIEDAHTGKLFVLEVNRSPQFEAFEKCTKINVAGELVKYIEGKCVKN
ncbi:MAG: RimK family alpha-L-glutamate ligase [Candidatus Diapherotrites archaeon]|nr:RimK family alpha-L-glutamate ligase [Candidatus Diapherotrites archaeon]